MRDFDRAFPAAPDLDLLAADGFVLATGFECSAPLIGGGVRIDQLAKTRHYAHLEQDLAMVRELGISVLRYGIPIHVVNPAPGVYDWAIPDRAFEACRRLGITVIADLVHFGVPDDLDGFGDPRLPARVAEYAVAFATRYPHITHYTVVNEPLITATFSARFGFWNERGTGDQSFVRTMLNVARAAVVGTEAVRSIKPEARFLLADSCESYHPVSPGAIEQADMLNELRFLGYELVLGRPLSDLMAAYLAAHGAAAEELAWFREHGRDLNCIIGNDYYAACEKEVLADGTLVECGERSGYYRLAYEYYERLHLPFMAAETNSAAGDPVDWLNRQWTDVLRLRRDGLPIRGFTWYGFISHVDWDTLLTEDNGRENRLGLVDLDRSPMPVYAGFKELVDSLAGG